MFLHSTTPFYWSVCACVSWCLIMCCSKYFLNLIDRYSPPWSILSTLIFRLASFSNMCLNNLNFWNASSLCFIKHIHTFLVLSSMKVTKYNNPNNDGTGKGPQRFEWISPNDYVALVWIYLNHSLYCLPTWQLWQTSMTFESFGTPATIFFSLMC